MDNPDELIRRLTGRSPGHLHRSHESRSRRAKAWVKNPGRYDLPGVDTPSAGFDAFEEVETEPRDELSKSLRAFLGDIDKL